MLSTLKNQNVHERDSHIQFFEKYHQYKILTDPGSKYTSVTTWNHSHFPKFNADEVIANMMKGKNWNESNKYWGLTPTQIKAMWNSNSSSVASAGTDLHADIETFMNLEMPEPRRHAELLQVFTETTNTSEEWGFFMDFVRAFPELKPFRTEWMIYDEELKLAGSIDMVYENPDGTLMIYDWKRSKEISKTNGWNKSAITPCIDHLPDTNFWHYALQLNTYKTILERKYGKIVTCLYLVRLHPDNPKKTFELLKVPILEDEMTELIEHRLKLI
jgi:ATP-dependent exoDNAse (exonuclease V) beta subunit